MKLTSNESIENYVETILVLSKELPVVRAIDIANELQFSKPSVSVAMKNLKEKNYIKVDKSGFITLTDEGNDLANMVYERHTILTECLVHLGVDREIAANDACRIEHIISKETFEAIKKHMKQ